ncbi:response regulator transcription factor [Streptomyces sp. NPDC056352]|uniref:helix-turn-helix transcriptional regulator n=1 Tax=Streptomyces sp. NPDC056352 TaxID=3345791 RepID=UPI0035E34E4D
MGFWQDRVGEVTGRLLGCAGPAGCFLVAGCGRAEDVRSLGLQRGVALGPVRLPADGRFLQAPGAFCLLGLVKSLSCGIKLLGRFTGVGEGDLWPPPGVSRGLAGAARRPLPQLFETPRERDVTGLVALGLSNEEIADRLFVSPLTAKTHVNRAMTKLAARDRAQLVVIAYECGLVSPATEPGRVQAPA